jgi:hypothetical protein
MYKNWRIELIENEEYNNDYIKELCNEYIVMRKRFPLKKIGLLEEIYSICIKEKIRIEVIEGNKEFLEPLYDIFQNVEIEEVTIPEDFESEEKIEKNVIVVEEKEKKRRSLKDLIPKISFKLLLEKKEDKEDIGTESYVKLEEKKITSKDEDKKIRSFFLSPRRKKEDMLKSQIISNF